MNKPLLAEEQSAQVNISQLEVRCSLHERRGVVHPAVESEPVARLRVVRPPRASRQPDAARGLERDLLPSFPATAAVVAPRSATAAVALSVARGRSTAVSATDGRPDDPESAWRIAWCCLTCTQF